MSYIILTKDAEYSVTKEIFDSIEKGEIDEEALEVASMVSDNIIRRPKDKKCE